MHKYAHTCRERESEPLAGNLSTASGIECSIAIETLLYGPLSSSLPISIHRTTINYYRIETVRTLTLAVETLTLDLLYMNTYMYIRKLKKKKQVLERES